MCLLWFSIFIIAAIIYIFELKKREYNALKNKQNKNQITNSIDNVNMIQYSLGIINTGNSRSYLIPGMGSSVHVIHYPSAQETLFFQLRSQHFYPAILANLAQLTHNF